MGPEVVATVPMVRTGGPVPSRSWVGKTGNFVSKATVSLASRCGNKAVHDELASRCLKKRRAKRHSLPFATPFVFLGPLPKDPPIIATFFKPFLKTRVVKVTPPLMRAPYN